MKLILNVMILLMTIFLTEQVFATKLVTLNIWGGQIKEPLIEYMQSNKDVDIFCLQEVYDNASHKVCTDDAPVELNIFSELAEALPEHRKYFSPVVDGIYGIGMLISQDVSILDRGEVSIYDNPNYVGIGPTHGRILQWVLCGKDTERFYVVNVHGLWNGKGKSDSPQRIFQSKRIRSFIDSLDAPVVLCGDFNLTPDTKSMAILQKDMDDHITIHNITSTRTSYYPKEIRYADYIITSPDINVEEFKVMPEEVSDHAPLYLKFQVG